MLQKRDLTDTKYYHFLCSIYGFNIHFIAISSRFDLVMTGGEKLDRQTDRYRDKASLSPLTPPFIHSVSSVPYPPLPHFSPLQNTNHPFPLSHSIPCFPDFPSFLPSFNPFYHSALSTSPLSYPSPSFPSSWHPLLTYFPLLNLSLSPTTPPPSPSASVPLGSLCQHTSPPLTACLFLVPFTLKELKPVQEERKREEKFFSLITKVRRAY